MTLFCLMLFIALITLRLSGLFVYELCVCFSVPAPQLHAHTGSLRQWAPCWSCSLLHTRLACRSSATVW